MGQLVVVDGVSYAPDVKGQGDLNQAMMSGRISWSQYNYARQLQTGLVPEYGWKVTDSARNKPQGVVIPASQEALSAQVLRDTAAKQELLAFAKRSGNKSLAAAVTSGTPQAVQQALTKTPSLRTNPELKSGMRWMGQVIGSRPASAGAPKIRSSTVRGVR